MSHSRSSPQYSHGHESAVLASHAARTAANSAAYLLPFLEPGMRVLDVGFGPATITLDLAEAVAPGEVVGVENTDAPFETARQNAAARGDERTAFVRGDALNLPFADDTFDVTHAHQVLQHLTDPVRALREMARVTRRGGQLAVRDADYLATHWFPELPELEHWRQTYRQIARSNRAEPDAGRHLRAWARAAGLHNVTISSSNWCYATTEACRGWGESQANRVGGPTFRAQAKAQGVGPDAVDAMVAAWRAWGAHPDATYVIPNVELLARV
ncbi:methyltransferase domain-containing protein [Gulosibacter molinativorax]|uniref:Methyltransferase domain-containing protein n=1 Tax=Gulosibacter molinativorax TaxID=256821 RepID=A0ABT7C572_9MICO|nr:methyltransferase domain-containing protein [Gulosibacter molinativorax]MDJ1370338.1 methyltransferase domain-containing protein [Gulosibacter molinativorax]QUY61251.1 UbiE/COQ5 family methlytransferase [Gulosibacter molinativorax]